MEDLRFALGQDIHVLIAPDYQISERINELYGGESAAMTDLMQELNNMQVNNETEDSAAAPVIRFVDLVITQAIKEKASDIHFEPFEKEFKIRYRVDGSLYEMQPPPVHLSVPVISRVKVMANMNIAERRVPQDGRIVKQIGNRAVDMRVSSLPTQYGESVVLRVLDRSSVNLNLDNLGLPRIFMNIFWIRSTNPTAFSSSPVPPAPARPPRCMPPCGKSIPLIPRC